MLRQLIAFKVNGEVFATMPYVKGNARRLPENTEHFTRHQAKDELLKMAADQGIELDGFYNEASTPLASERLRHNNVKRAKRRVKQKRMREHILKYKLMKETAERALAELDQHP